MGHLSSARLWPVSMGLGSWRGMWDDFVMWLFCCRISKGLSEKIFAKSEEQRTRAEEDVEDAGRVKLLNHLDMICIFE